MSIIKDHIDKQNANYEWTPFSATMVAEGDFAMAGIDAPTEELVLSAWQYLIDTDTIFHLQDSFQRTALQLIIDGKCLEHPDWRNA